jgi:hypothetical protein
MSIATLKRKTEAKYNNMSVGAKNGFSLNGTHRSQGYVGQTSLSRSLPRTLMKGNTIRGHGGCCGKFPIYPIVQSAVTSQEDPTVVKMSSINTSGMIEEKLHCMSNLGKPGFIATKSDIIPYTNVKPDFNQNLNSQSDYVARIGKETVKEADACHVSKYIGTGIKTYSGINKSIFRSTITGQNQPICVYTKPESNYVAMEQGKYITKLHDKCTENDIINVKKPTMGTPFVGFN